MVETVGAGQSETAVADMVDMFLLILPPAAGDELQGLKRGIIELADLILVNKADGALLDHATRAAAEYANALHLVRPSVAEWRAAVRAVSALTGSGVDAVWDDVARFRAALQASGAWERRRAEQARAALWAEIGDGLLERFRAAPAVAARLAEVEREVTTGARTPAVAAQDLLAIFLSSDQCRGRIKPRLAGLFDDEGGHGVEMRRRHAGGAGERLDGGQDAVDLGRAAALEILQHRGFVRRSGPPAVGALDRDLGGDAVRPRRGEALGHQRLGEREQLVVPADDADRLAGQRADRAGAEVAQELVPDLDADRRC